MSSEMAIRVLAQQSVMRSMKIYWKGGERRSFSFLIIIYLSFLKKKRQEVLNFCDMIDQGMVLFRCHSADSAKRRLINTQQRVWNRSVNIQ
jgi:hypothetical protein